MAIAFSIGPLNIRWYGILIVSGIVAAMAVSSRLLGRRGVGFDDLLDAALVAVPLGLVCARAYYVAFNWDYYGAHPEHIVAVWRGGIAIHGSILGGLLGLWLVVRHKRQSVALWADAVAPGLLLAQSIGRWGNFFNQEAYGYETDLPWAMYIDGAMRHPTFLYESLWDLAGFGLLLWLTLRCADRLCRGDVAAAYLIYYSLGRCFIEYFRTDSLMLGPLKMAQVISLVWMAAGLAILWWNRRYRRPETGGRRRK